MKGSEEDHLRLGWQIREKVDQWTGLPISVGIAPTKTLAKAANHRAKKQKGVDVLTDPEKIQKVLASLDVEEVWGIGRRLAKRLRQKRIFSAGQLASSGDQWIRKEFSVMTLRTAMELRGVSCFPCDEVPEVKKSILCSRTFRNPIDNQPDLIQAIADFTTIAAEKLRKQNSLAPMISVFIATSPFQDNYYSNSSHFTLPIPSSYTPELITYARRALDTIYRSDFSYKRAGVQFIDLVDATALQMDFWDKGKDFEKKKRLMEAIDKINFRYDELAVHSASFGHTAKMEVRSFPHLSPLSPQTGTSF